MQRRGRGAEAKLVQNEETKCGSGGFHADQRGTATIEYVVIVLTVTIGAAGAVALLGPGLVALFRMRVMWLSLPVP